MLPSASSPPLSLPRLRPLSPPSISSLCSCNHQLIAIIPPGLGSFSNLNTLPVAAGNHLRCQIPPTLGYAKPFPKPYLHRPIQQQIDRAAAPISLFSLAKLQDLSRGS
ncbi:hypothetical protein Tsubulata_049273 [Turnera subulata]|uniref:Uncharacterized protein n=1 Tax=Turnera subulata TaxID=218843 RepID=A0A9Q0FRX4_9ROSI|nr:hypothetical protein Tsubulata_049273 [Turnera subulata]